MITDLLERGTDNAPAIIGSDTEALRYGALRTHIESVVSTLNGYGLGSRDRVAIVLPNGPQMASAFVSIVVGVTTDIYVSNVASAKQPYTSMQLTETVLFPIEKMIY